MSTLSLRLYRRALAASGDFQAPWLEEAVSALHMAMTNERRRRGALAAAWLWIRAMADAIGLVGQSGDGGMWCAWGQDLRQSIRGLNRSRQYAATVIVTLALAIGGVTAVFRLADPMLFRRLPFPHAERLYEVSVSGGGTFGFNQLPDYFRAERAGLFEHMGTLYGPVLGHLVAAGDETDDLLGYAVTSGFLEMLGSPIQRGRLFSPAEFDAAAPGHGALNSGTPVLITDGLWTAAFGHREDIVGQPLQLENRAGRQAYTIVGVLTREFILPDAANEAPAFLVPGRLDRAAEGNKRSVAGIYGLLRSDTTAEATAAQLASIMAGVEKDYPQLPQGRTGRLIPVQEALFRRVRVPLLMLLGVTIGVLVLAIGNLAHLSLARGAERRREVTVRSALGGSRWRIARLMLTEAAILVATGTAAALVLGHGIFAAVMAAVPKLAHIYRLMPAELNGRVVAMSLFLAAVTLALFGVIPAVRSSVPDLRSALQLGSRGARGGSRITSHVLTVLQTSLGTSVLVVALLLVSSFARLVTAVHGIDENGLVLASVDLPPDYDATPERAKDLRRAVEFRVEQVTGQAIGWQAGIPGLTLPGALWGSATDATPASAVAIAFPADRTAMDAFRLQLVSGRLFTDDEARSNAAVAVIDRRTSEILWPGENAIGRTVYDAQVPSEPRTARQVIGVVETVKTDFKDEPAKQGQAFVPIHTRNSRGEFIWRGSASPKIVQALRDAVRDLEPRAKVGAIPLEPFERRFGEPRLLARMIGVLGVLTLLLTVTGVYAVVSHATAGRTGEIGVRVALGATSARVRAMIVREALWPATIGVAAGLAAAFWWAVRLKDLLFQVEPRSPWVFAAASLLVTVVVIIASGIPATRASKLNPVDALRAD
jgi:putative ABC transport system permease protein